MTSISNINEAYYQYASFTLKTATLILFLPLAERISTDVELQFTALLLNIMYLLLSAEFGFSIQISKAVGDHTDQHGTRNNFKTISRMSGKIFLILCVLASIFSIAFYLYFLNRDPSLRSFSVIYFFAVFVFIIQLYANKSYAIIMGTSFLKRLKLGETFIFLITLIVLAVNYLEFLNWELHVAAFLAGSLARSLMLFLLESHLLSMPQHSNGNKIHAKELIFGSAKVGVASVSTQLVINSVLTQTYSLFDLRTANEINIFSRIIQGVIIFVRQLTDLKFFQILRNTTPNSKHRYKGMITSLGIGLPLLIFCSFLASLVYSPVKSYLFETPTLIFTIYFQFWLLLVCININGLLSQQLLLNGKSIHIFITVGNIWILLFLFFSDVKHVTGWISISLVLLTVFIFIASWRSQVVARRRG